MRSVLVKMLVSLSNAELTHRAKFHLAEFLWHRRTKPPRVRFSCTGALVLLVRSLTPQGLEMTDQELRIAVDTALLYLWVEFSDYMKERQDKKVECASTQRV